MFFNEDNLYLESDAATPEMTDAEISEAVEAAQADTEFGTMSEGHEFYSRALEELSVINESYFNLREKMMNIEHIASLKAKDGLVSESEMFFNEGLENFGDKIKGVFLKMIELIKKLFNNFVNVVTGLFVSMKTIRGMNDGDIKKAWAAYSAKNGDKMKVNVLNFSSVGVKGIVDKAKVLSNDIKTDVKEIGDLFSGCDNEGTMKKLEEKLSRPGKFKARIDAKRDNVEQYLANNFAKDGKTTTFTKHEEEIDIAKFLYRFNFVKDYKKTITAVNGCKSQAIDAINEAIKAVQKTKKPSEAQKKVQGKVISEMRWLGNKQTSLFSKLTSIATSYYRESLLIVRRVLGTNRVESGKEKVKELTEGFDMAAYFGA